MTRHILLIAAALSVLGCQINSGPRVQISREQAKALNLNLSGGVAADKSGSLYLTTPGGLMQYDPAGKRLESMLNDPCPDLQDVALTPDGVVLALRSHELSTCVASYLIKLYDLPGTATLVSCDREFAYVLITGSKGSRLLRITLSGTNKGLAQPLLATEEQPRALCAVKGGCLVASGGNIVKVTDPAPQGQGQAEVTTVLLVSVRDPVTSIAADQGALIVYFATTDMTYAWIQGQVVPIFPAGNRLALSKDVLTICHGAVSNSQIIQIPAASQHAKTLLGRLNKNARPKKR